MITQDVIIPEDAAGFEMWAKISSVGKCGIIIDKKRKCDIAGLFSISRLCFFDKVNPYRT